MSSPVAAYHNLPMPPAGPSAPRQSSRNARSSRKTRCSTGPAVLLGGGAGMLGSSVENHSRAATGPQYPSKSNHLQPINTANTLFPVHFASSPVSPPFASPVSPNFNMHRAPSPLPAQSTSSHTSQPSYASTSTSSRKSSHPGSNSSLSTTASTSSRTLPTLQTPQSKPDQNHTSPFIVGSSSMVSHDSQGSMGRQTYDSPTPAMSRPKHADREMRSPTPTQRSVSESMARSSRESPTRQKASHPFSAAAAPSSIGASRFKPPPINLQLGEPRLSEEWVRISLSDENMARKAAPAGPPAPRMPLRLPVATMVPMKDSSPQRPNYERAHSAPLSPSRQRGEQAQRQGRGSLDQLRSMSSNGVPQVPRQRNNSLSTPPSLVLEHSNMRNLFKSGATRGPEMGRSSVDALRPSLDIRQQAVAKKDTKAISKEQHKALGHGSPLDGERKSSGLSLKKSSGALKALFNRNASGKGKERADTPPVPILEREKPKSRRPSTAPKETSANSVDSSPDFTSNAGRTPGETEHGRRSLGIDRSLYPTPPLMRNRSEDVQRVLQIPVRQRIPSRDLPPPPPLSPVPPIASEASKSPSTEQIKTASEDSLKGIEQGETPAKPKLSLLADALPASSLPYLSPLRASVVLEPKEDPAVTSEEAGAIPTVLSEPPKTPEASTSQLDQPILPLDLLSLPKLDLDFDFTFDKFDLTPTTPRKGSPRKPRLSPNSPTPTRSLTTRISPRPSPRITRANSERRRSASMEGHRSPIEMWAQSGFDSPDINRLFTSPNSSSVPTLSRPLEPSLSEDSHHAILEPSHERSPSVATSTDDTTSPSPRTPEDKTAELPSFPAVPNAQKLGAPPDIPLPALPDVSLPVAALAPAAIIEVKPIQSTKPTKAPRENIPVLVNRSNVIMPDLSRSTVSLARELERSLLIFRAPGPSTSADRTNIIRTDLLPTLEEVNRRTFGQQDAALKSLQIQCFGWVEALLFELRVEQPANERGACLEGLGAVFESVCFSEESLEGDLAHQARFTDAMVKCMTFVMNKLGAKGVFHNTLLFSGRFLAFAFFRVPHVGEQLVTVLPPPRGALMRFTRCALIDSELPTRAQPRYPKHLAPLCFDDSRKYTARLATLSAEFATEKERDAFLFNPGNWLRRWQSDDSELFPAFYRAYHRQLAVYLGPAVEYYESINRPLPASVLLRAPGYAHLATIFAKKCHSYILGSVNAVTTSSSAQAFEATETAGFRGSQKPAVLETANRRLVETLSTFANLRATLPIQGVMVECDGQQLFAGMLDLWTKNLISKTSLYAPKGVFCLFDLLDGIVDPPVDHITGERRFTEASLLDVPHLIHIIRMILTEGEHALTLVKVIAFVFTHWEVLTARHEDRKELCLDILLDKKLFERLLLFWSQSVRSYVLRLVVFRLGHLHTQKSDGIAHDVEIESVRLLQTRLGRIKKRYDELEPKEPIEQEEKVDPILTPCEGGSLPRSRSTITMVPESPYTGSAPKAEKLLGLGFGAVEKNEMEETPKKGKATNWFKKSFGGKKKKPAAKASSVTPTATPELQSTTRMVSSPVPESPSSSGDGHSPTGETRKRPPRITTSDASPIGKDAKSPSTFAFEFELPTMSPRSDTFDPTPSAAPLSPRRKSQPPSPRQPQSPHMSRSFSKRSSLLPPSTAEILALESPHPPRRMTVVREEDEGYDSKLHAYAIRMLAELEDAQKEYDEWWSEGGIGLMDGAPPRLTVAWPFHEGDD